MIAGKRVLAVIPARGGSKGIPRKNIREVGGKPLIAYTIETAKQSAYLDQVVVSSEDAEILAVASAFGAATLVRPQGMAADDTPSIAPVLHALDIQPGFDYVVLLQPTSPLRCTADIDGAINHCLRSDAPACVTICESGVSPLRLFNLAADGIIRRMVGFDVPARRQDVPRYYQVNGAVYVAVVPWLKERKRFISEHTLGYVMPEERSLDIDTEWDIEFCAFLLERSGRKQVSR